jgi:hypothetical protein
MNAVIEVRAIHAAALMRSSGIVLDEVLVEDGLHFVESLKAGAATFDAQMLVEQGAVPALDDAIVRHDDFGTLGALRARISRCRVVRQLAFKRSGTEVEGKGIIGLDIHRAFAEAVAWKDGRLSRLGRIIMRREPLEEFAKQLSKSDIVVIESTRNAASVAALIGPHVRRVVMLLLPIRSRSDLLRMPRSRPIRSMPACWPSSMPAAFLPEIWIADDTSVTSPRDAA